MSKELKVDKIEIKKIRKTHTSKTKQNFYTEVSAIIVWFKYINRSISTLQTNSLHIVFFELQTIRN